MTADYTFGTWIKRRRKALDLTQEELAQRVGCSMSTIFKIEADERRPSRQITELLAAHLEIPLDQRELFIKVARQEKITDSLDIVSPLPGLAPSLPTPSPQNYLPIFLTPLIGRKHEMDIVAKQLLEPTCRLLTLTGPGGVGKTRLAVEAGRLLEDEFSDGIYYLSMTAVNRIESFIPAIADGLGVVLSGPAEPVIQITSYLGHKKILLVFDNMEHLVVGGGVLREILQSAPNVKLLLTSREQMHLQSEWVFEVQGLPVPEDARPVTLETNSSIALFLQRARQASQDLSLSPEDIKALVSICQSVDGLPLAIELAASWIRSMSVQEIARELENNTNFLETTYYDVPDRHRSIKKVVDHSWALLNQEEKVSLVKLSVFDGGFTRAAAAAVTGTSVRLLSSLVSKSLLRYHKKSDRYDFHGLIRQFALLHLHELPDVEVEILNKRSLYYSQWLADLESPLKSSQQIQISALIRLETANWLSAWSWSVKNHQLELLRKMIPSLYWYYEIHGHYTEALYTFTQAVQELRAAGAPRNLARTDEVSSFAFLVDQLAWFEFRTGNIERATSLFTESLELANKAPDPEVLYHIYGNWGYMAAQSGETASAKRFTLQALKAAQTLRSQWHIAIPINVLGIVEFQEGNLNSAYQQLSDALSAWRAVGDPRGLTFCMIYLASAAMLLGMTEIAEKVLHESYAIAQEKTDRWAQAFSLDLLGQVLILKGQLAIAYERFQESLLLSKEIGDQWASAQTLIHLGETQASMGNTSEARRLFIEAYENARKAKWAPTILETLVAFLMNDEEISAGTKLTIIWAVLSHPAITPKVRLSAEQIKKQSLGRLTEQQVELVQLSTHGKSPETWAQEVFSRVLYNDLPI